MDIITLVYNYLVSIFFLVGDLFRVSYLRILYVLWYNGLHILVKKNNYGGKSWFIAAKKGYKNI